MRLIQVQPHNIQQGLSLVELMIAMTISVTLLAGIAQIVISNKDTYNFQQTQSLNQENSRFAFYFIDAVLNKTGYITAPQNSREAVFPSLSASAQCASFREGQLIANSLEGTGFCVRYQRAENTEVDCSGNSIATPAGFVTRLFYDAATNTLRCGAQGAAATALLDNIENMQVSYRILVNSDTQKPAAVAIPADWREIIAIQIDLLTASTIEASNAPQVYRFPLSSAATTTAADNRVYRSSTKTTMLRNGLLQEAS